MFQLASLLVLKFVWYWWFWLIESTFAPIVPIMTERLSGCSPESVKLSRTNSDCCNFLVWPHLINQTTFNVTFYSNCSFEIYMIQEEIAWESETSLHHYTDKAERNWNSNNRSRECSAVVHPEFISFNIWQIQGTFSRKTPVGVQPSVGWNVASLAAVTFQEVKWALYNLNVLRTECVCQFILEGTAAKGYLCYKSWC